MVNLHVVNLYSPCGLMYKLENNVPVILPHAFSGKTECSVADQRRGGLLCLLLRDRRQWYVQYVASISTSFRNYKHNVSSRSSTLYNK